MLALPVKYLVGVIAMAGVAIFSAALLRFVVNDCLFGTDNKEDD